MFSSSVIDPSQITDPRQALLCARLYLRGAKRLFHGGSVKRGTAALYDSVLFGMYYYIVYIVRHEGCADVDRSDAAAVFHLLARVGIFEDQHTFNRLSLAVEHILWQGSDSFHANAILAEVEDMLRKLGVMKIQKTQ
jgi:hypothetical protein